MHTKFENILYKDPQFINHGRAKHLIIFQIKEPLPSRMDVLGISTAQVYEKDTTTQQVHVRFTMHKPSMTNRLPKLHLQKGQQRSFLARNKAEMQEVYPSIMKNNSKCFAKFYS